MMRYLLFGVLLALGGLAVAQETVPPAQPSRPTYTALITSVAPELREGRTFVPVRAIAEQFGAGVAWLPETREVRITRPDAPDITLTIGSRTAQVDDRTVTLDAAPFIDRGNTMVPLRFIAEAYNVPVAYDATTRSVRLTRDDRIYVLPLPDTRTGIHIYDPQPGELVRNPVTVQGQANVYEGHLTIEVQDMQGMVLGRTIAIAGMGGFYPFSTHIYYNLPSEDAIDGQIVVYSQDGRGNGRILARDAVKVRLASTI